jgi:hypothetical protein
MAPAVGAEVFTSAGDLREAILEGRFATPGTVARIVVPGAPVPADGGWQPIARLACSHADLRAAYRPVWDTGVRYMWIGAAVGIGLKLLETTLSIFSVDGGAGFLWLLTLGSIAVSSRWALAPLAVIYFSFKAGIRANLFITAIAAALVGVAFGAPIGLVIGTLVGYSRREKLPMAPDAEPEGSRPTLPGVALPVVWLGFAIPAYVWFNVKALEWMAR